MPGCGLASFCTPAITPSSPSHRTSVTRDGRNATVCVPPHVTASVLTNSDVIHPGATRGRCERGLESPTFYAWGLVDVASGCVGPPRPTGPLSAAHRVVSPVLVPGRSCASTCSGLWGPEGCVRNLSGKCLRVGSWD